MMMHKSSVVSVFMCFWMLGAIISNVFISYLYYNPYISLVIYIFPLLFFLVPLFFSVDKSQSFSLYVKSLFLYLLLFLMFHVFNGKELFVIIFGLLDNFKFLLVLLVTIAIFDNKINLNYLGKNTLNLSYNVILLGVLFGFFQQINNELIYFFESSVDYKYDYRYGILRVPSFYTNVNAFAKVSFLLIPLAVVLDKDLKFPLCVAIFAFTLTFSRQFIVGMFISTIVAAYHSGLFTKKNTKTIILSTLSFMMFVLIIVINGDDDYRNSEHDGQLLSIPTTFIRGAVATTSVNAANDNPVFGVGSGYFGGNIGSRYAINEELENYGLMNLIPFFDIEYFYLDTQLFQLLGEFGYFGFGLLMFSFVIWNRKITQFDCSEKNKFFAYLVFYQFVFSAFLSPVFNFPYYSIPSLFLTYFIVSKDNV
ncbi:hypothetical protein [Vibrio splendidus]|uniref:hypothetical protein n=1 Tax=Vibrio splendidus TaxID=29497 RepID=UPI0035509124